MGERRGEEEERRGEDKGFLGGLSLSLSLISADDDREAR